MRNVINRQPVDLLPSYHLLVPDRSDYTYSCTARAFESHLELIRPADSNEPYSPLAVRLTFDDGHASQFRYGLPLLQKHGVRALFFAIVGWTGQRSGYMTWTELRELVQAGHEVQSHGMSHVQLTQCGDTELSNELANSRSELQERLGISVDAISIPFGRWNERVIRACSKAGYSRVYTSDPFSSSQPYGTQQIGRWMVNRNTTPEQLGKLLRGDRGVLRRTKVKHQCKLLVRAALGERIYDELWGMLGSRSSLNEVTRSYPGLPGPR